jgi:hypothetical protein
MKLANIAALFGVEVHGTLWRKTMKSMKRFLIPAIALLGAITTAGCVYYPSRPYYYGNAYDGHVYDNRVYENRAYYSEYYPDGYTPYYTNYYARPYVTAVWVSGGYHHGHWVAGHWR